MHQRLAHQRANPPRFESLAKQAGGRQAFHIASAHQLATPVSLSRVGDLVDGHRLQITNGRCHTWSTPLMGVGKRPGLKIVGEQFGAIHADEPAHQCQRLVDGGILGLEWRVDKLGGEKEQFTLDDRKPGKLDLHLPACRNVLERANDARRLVDPVTSHHTASIQHPFP